MIGDNIPAQVEAYFEERLVGNDEILAASLQRSAVAGLDPIAVTAMEGAFLQIIVSIKGARRVLEIGTLGGYSTIWMARALPKDGILISLEVDPKCAVIAQDNIDHAGLSGIVDIRVGMAKTSMDHMISSNYEPFDLIFIDADKQNNVAYLTRALKLAKSGTVIICDNIVRNGEVSNLKSDDLKVKGVQELIDLVQKTPNLTASAIQTVSGKSYDGVLIAVVD